MMITELKVLGDHEVEYTINAKDGVLHCTCPDHQFRGGLCKHMRFVAASMNVPVPELATA